MVAFDTTGNSFKGFEEQQDLPGCHLISALVKLPMGTGVKQRYTVGNCKGPQTDKVRIDLIQRIGGLQGMIP